MQKLIQCEDCGGAVGVNAISCPTCGSIMSNQPNYHKQKVKLEKRIRANEQGKSFLLYIVAIFVIMAGFGALSEMFTVGVLLLIGGILCLPPIRKILENKGIERKTLTTSASLLLFFGIIGAGVSSRQSTDIEPTSQQEGAVATTQQSVQSNWSYEEQADKMRNATIYYAKNKSTNRVKFDFPYSNSNLNIVVRNKQGKNEVMITVDSGQFHCGYDDCYISAKFDNEPIKRYNMGMADDVSLDVLFISSNTGDFIKKLKSAQKVTIEAPFFQSGRAQFDFNVAGLEWKH